MNDDQVEEDLFDVATNCSGRLTLLPVKVTDLNALFYDSNDGLALSLYVLIKDLVVKLTEIYKNILCGVQVSE